MHLTRGSSHSLLAHLGYIFSLILLVGILHGNLVTGSPFQKRQDDGIDPDDPSSDLDDSQGGDPFSSQTDGYPSLDECRKKCSVAADKSVFYSKVGDHTDKPQKFADQLPNGVLMRESFPSGFTDKNSEYTGYKKFMERTSQAFAEKTSGVAYVLLPTDNTDISKSVWTKIEKGALIVSGGACTRIIKVDPDSFDNKCILWDRNGKNDPNMANCNEENGPVPRMSNHPPPHPASSTPNPNKTYMKKIFKLTTPPQHPTAEGAPPPPHRATTPPAGAASTSSSTKRRTPTTRPRTTTST